MLGNEINQALSEEHAYIERNVSLLPQANQVGSEPRTMFLDGAEVYKILRAPDKDLLSKWAKKSLYDFARRLDAPPEGYARSDEEKYRSKRVSTTGNLRRRA